MVTTPRNPNIDMIGLVLTLLYYVKEYTVQLSLPMLLYSATTL